MMKVLFYGKFDYYPDKLWIWDNSSKHFSLYFTKNLYPGAYWTVLRLTTSAVTKGKAKVDYNFMSSQLNLFAYLLIFL